MIKITKDWTLFLDRDGVINRKLDNDYVKTIREFDFLPKVKQSISEFKKIFKRIVIVTNQQGVGKGLMTENDLEKVHTHMLSRLHQEQILVDKVYFCPDLAAQNSINRKPNIGMALQAQKDFPEINFAKSVMIGDSLSDMEFGRNAGMTTIFITPSRRRMSAAVDYECDSLFEAQKLLDY
jgi:histidinol-phosphate phosphatase family protein